MTAGVPSTPAVARESPSPLTAAAGGPAGLTPAAQPPWQQSKAPPPPAASTAVTTATMVTSSTAAPAVTSPPGNISPWGPQGALPPGLWPPRPGMPPMAHPGLPGQIPGALPPGVIPGQMAAMRGIPMGSGMFPRMPGAPVGAFPGIPGQMQPGQVPGFPPGAAGIMPRPGEPQGMTPGLPGAPSLLGTPTLAGTQAGSAPRQPGLPSPRQPTLPSPQSASTSQATHMSSAPSNPTSSKPQPPWGKPSTTSSTAEVAKKPPWQAGVGGQAGNKAQQPPWQSTSSNSSVKPAATNKPIPWQAAGQMKPWEKVQIPGAPAQSNAGPPWNKPPGPGQSSSVNRKRESQTYDPFENDKEHRKKEDDEIDKRLAEVNKRIADMDKKIALQERRVGPGGHERKHERDHRDRRRRSRSRGRERRSRSRSPRRDRRRSRSRERERGDRRRRSTSREHGRRRSRSPGRPRQASPDKKLPPRMNNPLFPSAANAGPMPAGRPIQRLPELADHSRFGRWGGQDVEKKELTDEEMMLKLRKMTGLGNTHDITLHNVMMRMKTIPKQTINSLAECDGRVIQQLTLTGELLLLEKSSCLIPGIKCF